MEQWWKASLSLSDVSWTDSDHCCWVWSAHMCVDEFNLELQRIIVDFSSHLVLIIKVLQFSRFLIAIVFLIFSCSHWNQALRTLAVPWLVPGTGTRARARDWNREVCWSRRSHPSMRFAAPEYATLNLPCPGIIASSVGKLGTAPENCLRWGDSYDVEPDNPLSPIKLEEKQSSLQW